MKRLLEERLKSTRHRHFIGRVEERRRFGSALAAAALPFHVLFVYGPAGCGKTALLHEYEFMCSSAGGLCVYLNARDIEPSAASLIEALRWEQHSGLEQWAGMADLYAWYAAQPGPVVILLDAYELLSPLERWIWSSFLPSLPQNVLVVAAGRRPPPAELLLESGLRSFVHLAPLGNLTEEESRAFLEAREAPAGQIPAVLAFAHGNPLALALVADVFSMRPDLKFAPQEVPDVVGVLLKRLLHEAPTAEYQQALEAAVVVRDLDETLLSALLERDDVHCIFQWLRGLSIMQASRRGLFPHDLARTVLAEDLKWRNREQYNAFQKKARRYYTRQLRFHREGASLERILSDYFFLYRDHDLVAPFFRKLEAQWAQQKDWRQDTGGPRDHAEILQIIERHEGAEAAALAAAWLARRPEWLLVFRGVGGRVEGFVYTIPMHELASAEAAADPALARAARWLEAQAPLREGEKALYFRFWMDREAHQGVSPVQSLFFVHTISHYLTTQRLAFTFLPCAQPEFWQPVFTFVGLQRLPDTDFGKPPHTYGVFGHDWRAVDPASWLDRIAEKGDLLWGYGPIGEQPTVVVLDRHAFTAAVREALRHFLSHSALSGNPLLSTRMVVGGCGGDFSEEARTETLCRILSEAAAVLEQSPREKKFFRALDYTYFSPQPSQERAAEQLGLPFSTYRRYLRKGIEALVEILWTQELKA